jgi:hypothetical protein
MSMKIRAGDVLLFPNAGTWIDRAIGIVSPRYTHVGIALDSHRYLDARMWRVSIRVVDSQPFRVYRPRANQHQVKAGLIWALSHNQEFYSTWSAILAGFLRLMGLRRMAYSLDNRWICSEFVAGALRAMGLAVCEGAALNDIVPDDLAGLASLDPIDD